MSKNNGVSKALAIVLGICASIPQVGAAKRGNGIRRYPGSTQVTGNMKRGANQLKVNQVQVGQNMPSKAKGGFWIGPNGRPTKGTFAVGGTGVGVLVINGVIFLPRLINGKWIWQKSKKKVQEEDYLLFKVNNEKEIEENNNNENKDENDNNNENKDENDNNNVKNDNNNVKNDNENEKGIKNDNNENNNVGNDDSNKKGDDNSSENSG